jgi:hypothetical protein
MELLSHSRIPQSLGGQSSPKQEFLLLHPQVLFRSGTKSSRTLSFFRIYNTSFLFPLDFPMFMSFFHIHSICFGKLRCSCSQTTPQQSVRMNHTYPSTPNIVDRVGHAYSPCRIRCKHPPLIEVLRAPGESVTPHQTQIMLNRSQVREAATV